jgi:hypothetical protein
MSSPHDLDVEITYPDGSTTTWDSNSPLPEDRPRGIGFRTARYDGFKDANCELSRRIDRDYPDAQLLYGFALRGGDGSIAYEGQISGLQRSLTDTHSMGVQAAGLMANAKDRKFWQVFVDRDLSQWTVPLLARRSQMALAGVPTGKIAASSSSAGLVWEVPNEALPTSEDASLHYTAPQGTTAAWVAYQGTRTGAFTGFEAPTIFPTDDQLTYDTGLGITLDSLPHDVSLVTPRNGLLIRARVSAGPVTPAAGHLQTISKIAVYGNHGLATYPVTNADGTTEPNGVYASDVIRWLIANYCPLLNDGGVQDTTYPIGHLVFRERTYPYDAMITVNSFHRWGLECWEGGTVHYGPVDLGDYDWELRLDDFGFKLDGQGDSAENVANAIEVTYTDALDGQRKVLTSDEHAELRDTNPLNPVNRAGRYRSTDFEITQPALEGMALEIGRAALAEFNQAKGPGTASKTAYIKDRQGNEQPVWKVRAGDRVCITDHPDERNHLVYETNYDHSSLTGQFAIDDSFQRLDAFLDRYSVGLQAANVA